MHWFTENLLFLLFHFPPLHYLLVFHNLLLEIIEIDGQLHGSHAWCEVSYVRVNLCFDEGVSFPHRDGLFGFFFQRADPALPQGISPLQDQLLCVGKQLALHNHFAAIITFSLQEQVDLLGFFLPKYLFKIFPNILVFVKFIDVFINEILGALHNFKALPVGL